MISYFLVAIGGAAGTSLHYAATRSGRWKSERIVVVINLLVSAALGVLTGLAYRGSVYTLLCLGFLAAAAPFTALGIEAARVQGPARVRRVVLGVGANVVAGAAMALLGYMSVRFSIALYRKAL